MICLLGELVEPWRAAVSSELPAVELPREQCGAHFSSVCCMSRLLLSQGFVPLFLPAVHSQILEQSPGKGGGVWEGEVRVRGR